MWRNSYGRLFKNVGRNEGTASTDRSVTPSWPDAVTDDQAGAADNEIGDLLFKWAPEMKGLITPSLSSLPVGSDGWALHQGWVSVTPLRASFGEPHTHKDQPENLVWKLKL